MHHNPCGISGKDIKGTIGEISDAADTKCQVKANGD